MSFFDDFVVDIISFLFVLVYHVQLNWQLSLIAVCGTVITSISQYVVTKHTERFAKEKIEIEQHISAQVEEIVDNIQQIKSMNIGEYVISKAKVAFNDIAAKTVSYTLKTKSVDQVAYMLFEVLKLLLYAFGGYQVSEGKLTPGGFMAFYSYLGWLDYSFGSMWKTSVRFSNYAASISLIESIDALPRDNDSSIGHRDMNIDVGLLLNDVSYKYDSSHEFTLNEVNMSISRGKPTVLYGRSGSGKTTLLNLITGFYPVDSGEIILDGMILNELSPEHRGQYISYVPQNAVLFSDTIRQLISIDLQLSDEQIWRYLYIVDMDNFVRTLPMMLDTVISRKSITLSTGQRHRISIAQALAREKRVLILDEPTANLDTHTKKTVIERIDSWGEERVLLYVMHDHKDIPLNYQIINIDDVV